MKKLLTIVLIIFAAMRLQGQDQPAHNPLIFADVPDIAMVRVGDTYYMSSTTMHMSPGVPIMRSKDLSTWETVGYAYDRLVDNDELNLTNGKNSYGKGSWASCIRHHNGRFYVSTFAHNTGSTHFYITDNIESGQWQSISFKPAYHDHTVFFDDDGHTYMIYGGNRLRIVELKSDLTGIVEGTDRVLIENASAPAGNSMGLGAEGSQLYKYNGKYYLFNICWPRGGMRTVVVHRADNIAGPYEGRVAFQDKGIAQGSIIDTEDGRWFAYLFRDYGAVGRIPYLVPMTWEDGWPIIGIDGKAPDTLPLPNTKGLMPGIVASDEFTRTATAPALPLVWQWNHNPDNDHWSVTAREGYLRLTTSRIDTILTTARNTLTQRTFGPTCSGYTHLDASGMRDGDYAGLCLLQECFGQLGILNEKGKPYLVMKAVERARTAPVEQARVPLTGTKIYLKAECNYRDMADTAHFYYSHNGTEWLPIGKPLQMRYLLSHFMGYRFGLFNYATQSVGGHADFDFFRIAN